MKLEMLGICHATSTLETRAKAAVGAERLASVTEQLLREPDVDGAVVLSTCNRVEIYCSPHRHLDDARLRGLFAASGNLTEAEAAAAYIKRDEQAVEHLFRVASGLESQMLGEVQILAQVKTAYQAAIELACTNGVLNALFLRAIECGKLVRHRTAISQGAVSVAYAAVDVAQRVFHNFSECKILLVGAGDTTRLAAKYLADFGATQWRVSNRTRANGQALADLLGGAVCAFPPVPDDVLWADVIVTATGAPEPVIRMDAVGSVLEQRKDPLLVLDLAVPCDVDAALKRCNNVYLYTVDDFKEMVAANLKSRAREALRAEKLVARHVADFGKWYTENRVAPTIEQLKDVLETIRVHEVQSNARRFSPDNRDQVDEFSKSLMRKVTSLIIANMKRASLDRNDLSLARAVALAFAGGDDAHVNRVLEKLDHELSH